MVAPAPCALGPVDFGVKPALALRLSATSFLEATTMSPEGMIEANSLELAGFGLLVPPPTEPLAHPVRMSASAAGIAAKANALLWTFIVFMRFLLLSEGEPGFDAGTLVHCGVLFQRFRHCGRRGRSRVGACWCRGCRPRTSW